MRGQPSQQPEASAPWHSCSQVVARGQRLRGALFKCSFALAPSGAVAWALTPRGCFGHDRLRERPTALHHDDRDRRLVLSIEPLEVAEPAPGEVVVEMLAVPINPSDLGLLLAPADMLSARRNTVSGNAALVADVRPEFLQERTRLIRARMIAFVADSHPVRTQET